MVKPIERVSQRAVRSVGRARHRPPRDAARTQPVGSPGVGTRHVPVLPELHAVDLEAELGADLPLLADVVQHAHLRRHLLLRSAQDRA